LDREVINPQKGHIRCDPKPAISGFSFVARRDAFNLFSQSEKRLRIFIAGLTVNAGSLRMAYLCRPGLCKIAHVEQTMVLKRGQFRSVIIWQTGHDRDGCE
jgi:hypothetical protein